MINVFTSQNNKWNEYIQYMPIEYRDIYYTLDYHKLYEKRGKSEARCFVYEDGEKIALYPFLLNKIENENLKEDYFDIETVYGYTGPISNSNDKNFLSSFENEFLNYCKSNNILAEFIRFNPLIDNINIFKHNIEILKNRTTVIVNLDKDIQSIWENSISSKNRNMIRKAEKFGLKVRKSNDYSAFKKIYYKTMEKVKASSFYYFGDEYFENISKSDNCILFEVVLNDEVIAGGLFLKYGQYFHYHLSGSLSEYLKYAPNNLMLMEAIKYAKSIGLKKMHLGGGITSDPQDRLFKFKKSFSKQTLDFYIGKRVHNEQIYNKLCDEWLLNNPDKNPVYFLLYKQR
ncbi:lipid II:glycine glycyltransferase FemX [Tepidibacter thalassicus]|uniref:Acetyltransferase (GNAT) domain-containing protein n=1 Tax=Tepidibacter thalassicus DSM 15285 TaxID=1123350 RepID=A0A1M5R2V4_9FIRM|nr:peptidoglycan bridge formation glycyltransferase FemA/FemB family protein [Tepidibacter thalassicus]SHH20360.1 Acetyltransferase (GNAT) domain-containing protein [Tepidibacter thalassicus DSM 15285]